MLEVVEFNKKLYRYREEDKDTLILYNLRTGDMHFVIGSAKIMLQRFESEDNIEVSLDEKLIQYLKLIKVLKAKET
jgi:hypothetical protein